MHKKTLPNFNQKNRPLHYWLLEEEKVCSVFSLNQMEIVVMMMVLFDEVAF
jgi:hypothetical protein